MTKTRDQKRAAAFRPDPRLEKLLDLKRTDPAAFAKLPPLTRLACGHYAAAKAAHQATEEENER